MPPAVRPASRAPPPGGTDQPSDEQHAAGVAEGLRDLQAGALDQVAVLRVRGLVDHDHEQLVDGHDHLGRGGTKSGAARQCPSVVG